MILMKETLNSKSFGRHLRSGKIDWYLISHCFSSDWSALLHCLDVGNKASNLFSDIKFNFDCRSHKVYYILDLGGIALGQGLKTIDMNDIVTSSMKVIREVSELISVIQENKNLVSKSGLILLKFQIEQLESAVKEYFRMRKIGGYRLSKLDYDPLYINGWQSAAFHLNKQISRLTIWPWSLHCVKTASKELDIGMMEVYLLLKAIKQFYKLDH